MEWQQIDRTDESSNRACVRVFRGSRMCVVFYVSVAIKRVQLMEDFGNTRTREVFAMPTGSAKISFQMAPVTGSHVAAVGLGKPIESDSSKALVSQPATVTQPSDDQCLTLIEVDRIDMSDSDTQQLVSKLSKSYEHSLDADPPGDPVVLSASRGIFCACLCWKRPEMPPWMDMQLSCSKPGGSPFLNRLRRRTYGELLWGLNFAAAIVHWTFFALTFALAKGPVDVKLWSTIAVFNRPDLDELKAGNASVSFDFTPEYRLDADPPTISLRNLVAAFFFLSALAHSIVVVFGCYPSFYYWWIDQCRQPMRWVEYFLSSTCMIVAIAVFGGVRSVYLMLTLAALNATTITFGWVTEALSHPDADSRCMLTGYSAAEGGESFGKQVTVLGYHTRWEINARNRSLLMLACVPPWLLPFAAAVQRLGPWLLGFFPYGVLWYVLIHLYYESTQESRDLGVMPEFVDYIIWGQAILFTWFAVVMLLQQSSDWGCRNYYWLEIMYIISSLTAKAFLGSILFSQVFISDRFEDIFDVDRYIEREELRQQRLAERLASDDQRVRRLFGW